MSLSKRTIRDRDYAEILKKYGPLSNSDLCKKAAEHPHFKNLTSSGIEKDIDRFAKHYENLGIVIRNNGRLEWMAQPVKIPAQPKDEMTTQVADSVDSDSQHDAVQTLLRGMSDGSIRLKPKSPFWTLNRIKGEIYDEFMADIDLYNYHRNDLPFISGILETRIFNTAIKLRAYGFLEENKERSRPPPPASS